MILTAKGGCIFFFSVIFCAFFAAQKTGLSACIFCLVNQAKGYRSYPLRESKPRSGLDFAEFHGKP
jgi:hypothetical protein